jgi:nickel-dependent lactate racemase
MSAAAQIVREGGVIIIASECSDGIPSHGEYGRLLVESSSAAELHSKILSPNFSRHDQWQAQIQARIQQKCDVFVYSSYLSPEQIRNALLEPAASVEAALEQAVRKFGPNARICILPEGPQTIPYVSSTTGLP